VDGRLTPPTGRTQLSIMTRSRPCLILGPSYRLRAQSRRDGPASGLLERSAWSTFPTSACATQQPPGSESRRRFSSIEIVCGQGFLRGLVWDSVSDTFILPGAPRSSLPPRLGNVPRSGGSSAPPLLAGCFATHLSGPSHPARPRTLSPNHSALDAQHAGGRTRRVTRLARAAAQPMVTAAVVIVLAGWRWRGSGGFYA